MKPGAGFSQLWVQDTGLSVDCINPRSLETYLQLVEQGEQSPRRCWVHIVCVSDVDGISDAPTLRPTALGHGVDTALVIKDVGYRSPRRVVSGKWYSTSSSNSMQHRSFDILLKKCLAVNFVSVGIISIVK